MKTYPLKTRTLEEAIDFQFYAIDQITQNIKGIDMLNAGDYGVNPIDNAPIKTREVEKVIAKIFNADDAVLVRGSGTGALRYSILSTKYKGKNILVHKAPIYPTTKVTFDMANFNIIEANFNEEEELKKILQSIDIHIALVQFTRQKPDDSYLPEEVIKIIKKLNKEITIITDDNYSALKVKKLGNECGADLATFSTFKIQGPEGVGVVVGKQTYINKIKKMNYSGGSQVQGFESMEVLRAIVKTPVHLAIQSKVCDDLYKELIGGVLEHVDKVWVANAQSKVVIVKFKDDIAQEIINKGSQYGAAPYPVGAESKYEVVPMIYRVSGTFLEYDKELKDKAIRINPMRSGSGTIIRILKEILEDVYK